MIQPLPQHLEASNVPSTHNQMASFSRDDQSFFFFWRFSVFGFCAHHSLTVHCDITLQNHLGHCGKETENQSSRECVYVSVAKCIKAEVWVLNLGVACHICVFLDKKLHLSELPTCRTDILRIAT